MLSKTRILSLFPISIIHEHSRKISYLSLLIVWTKGFTFYAYHLLKRFTCCIKLFFCVIRQRQNLKMSAESFWRCLTLKVPITTTGVCFCLLKCLRTFFDKQEQSDLGPHCLPLYLHTLILLAIICSRCMGESFQDYS